MRRLAVLLALLIPVSAPAAVILPNVPSYALPTHDSSIEAVMEWFGYWDIRQFPHLLSADPPDLLSTSAIAAEADELALRVEEWTTYMNELARRYGDDHYPDVEHAAVFVAMRFFAVDRWVLPGVESVRTETAWSRLVGAIDGGDPVLLYLGSTTLLGFGYDPSTSRVATYSGGQEEEAVDWLDWSSVDSLVTIGAPRQILCGYPGGVGCPDYLMPDLAALAAIYAAPDAQPIPEPGTLGLMALGLLIVSRRFTRQ